MKRSLITLAVLLVVFALGMIVGRTGLQPVATDTALAAPVPAALAVPMPERCPSIHEAIRALESAESDMRGARHDFCGHKRDAMEITHRAIEQLRAAAGCDRCR